MLTLLDCAICRFQFQVDVPEPLTQEQPAECPDCGSRYRITSVNPLWYVRDLDCRVRLSTDESRQISEKQQQELDEQAGQVDRRRIWAIVRNTVATIIQQEE